MPGRVAIFIDGAYLEFVLKDEFQEARIDYQALSKYLAGDSDILRPTTIIAQRTRAILQPRKRASATPRSAGSLQHSRAIRVIPSDLAV